ncbi:hypothetical protein JXR93_07370 [bacterium]|nr:hypothetical protein [bacterium]
MIPIKNIYYMLCYAWDKVEMKDIINISVDNSIDLKNLLAKILISTTKIILKQGLKRDYIEKTEELRYIKGRVEISHIAQSRFYHKKFDTVCSYSDYSESILLNRVIHSTILRVIRLKDIDKNIKKDLSKLKRYFSTIDIIELNSSIFKNINYNRNDGFYKFIIDVCRFIYENTLPTESEGEYRFTDFTKDDREMGYIFECFVRNFYKVEQTDFKVVKKEIIKWNLTSSKEKDNSYIPQMVTDITLENSEQKIVIDTKFYKETLTTNYDKERVKSENLYQLFSYLINQEDGTEKRYSTTGVLLYPTIDTDYTLDFAYKNHKIKVRTVDLNKDWSDIHSRLIEILSD